MATRRDALAATCLLLPLAACTPPRPLRPAVTAPSGRPFRFRVEAIDVTVARDAGAAAGFIDRNRGERLATAAGAFLSSYLDAAGGPGRLRATIETATMATLPMPTAGGVRDLLVREPDRLFKGTLKVRLSVLDQGGREAAWTEAVVERTRPVLARTSALARDAEAEEVIDALLRQLDDALAKAIEENLGAYRV